MGAGHGEERTENMCTMLVTLEVFKLSGWLNADARCRESKGGNKVWGEGQSTGRRVTAGLAVCRGVLGCRLGAGHGEERTRNIWFMVVTLEVSKLSGWLNAGACCRVSQGGHTMRGEAWAEGGGVWAGGSARAACSARGAGSRL